MNKEDLKKLGIEDESLVQQIIVLHGKDIETHKASLATAKAEAEALKTQQAEANKMIEDFKKLDVNGIQKAADEWKQKAEKAEADKLAEISRIKYENALNSSLTGAKAKNPKAVRALLDPEGLKLTEDGSIVGLTEQLEKIKAENDYLFEDSEPTPKVVAGGSGKTAVTDAVVSAARKAAGLKVD